MLIVFAGLPGTGKTTLARLLAADLHAALLRIDAIEATIVRCGLAAQPVGPVGYVVAEEIAAGCLAVGTPVVVDAVNPVAEARAVWPTLAAKYGVSLRTIETRLSDHAEHRRRVRQRRSDLPGLVVPTWEQVRDRGFQPWDEDRDGPRLSVDTIEPPEKLLPVIRAYLDLGKA